MPARMVIGLVVREATTVGQNSYGADGHDQRLDANAQQVVEAVGAAGAAVLLISRSGKLRVGGACDFGNVLPPNPRCECVRPAAWGDPVALALALGRQVAVPTQGKPRLDGLGARVTFASRCAVAATPLRIGAAVVGILALYRESPDVWSSENLTLLSKLAESTSRIVWSHEVEDRRRRQVAGIKRILVDLCETAHEHANRLHAINALLDLGEGSEARCFASELLQRQARPAGELIGRITQPALAGLLLAEITLARESGISLAVSRMSRLSHLPEELPEARWLALVGDLLAYAYEDLLDAPPSRRQVMLTVINHGDGLVLKADDSRPLSPEDGLFSSSACEARREPFSASLLRAAARSDGGTLIEESQSAGAVTEVRVPA